MPAIEISNLDEWRGLLRDPELRAQIRLLLGNVETELDRGVEATVSETERHLGRHIESRRARLVEIDTQVGCVEAVCSKPGHGEFAVFQGMMAERKTALIEEKTQIEKHLASPRLAQEIARLKAVREEVTKQRRNAVLLLGLIAEIEEGREPSPVHRAIEADAAPLPERVAPATGRVGIVRRVAVLGRGFKPGAVLRVDGMEMVGPSYVQPGRLEGGVPAGLPVGRHPIIVVNPDGKSGILPNAYLAFA